MKVWAKTEEFSEGKFLVVRRDGTTPAWPHFVMGARDPAVPFALHAYATEAKRLGLDPGYCDSVRELAFDFDAYRKGAGEGDPDAPPHRTDLPMAIAMMRGELTLDTIARTLERIERLAMEGEDMRAASLATLLLNGKTPPHLDTL
jgi:hypothetical protein